MKRFHFEDHFPFLLKPVILIKIGRGVFFSLYQIILIVFGALGPCSFILLTFGTQCKNLPLCHLGQWGRLPALPGCLLVSGRVGWGRAAGPTFRKPGDVTALILPPNAGHGAGTSRGARVPLDLSACPLCSPPLRRDQLSVYTLPLAGHAPTNCLQEQVTQADMSNSSNSLFKMGVFYCM